MNDSPERGPNGAVLLTHRPVLRGRRGADVGHELRNTVSAAERESRDGQSPTVSSAAMA